MTDFSVVIPVRDGGPRLHDAVRSVLAQEPPAAEVIVVDDASSDGVPADVARQHAGVTVIPADGTGPGAARNTGLAHSTSRRVAFLDADDVWLPGHLADLADLDRAFPTAALLATGYVTAAVGADLPAASGEHRPQAVDYLRRAAREPGFVWTGAAAVDRAAALALGGFGAVRAGEDLVLWVRLALAGTVAWTPRVTAVYVRGTGGIMENLGVPIPARQVASLAQLSAALGAASDALAAGGDEGALRTYINGRVTLAARSALLHGDAPGVERLRSLRVAGPNPDRTVLDRVVDLPPVLLRPTAAAVGAANRVRRHLKATSR